MSGKGATEEGACRGLKATIKYLGGVEFPSSGLVSECVVEASVSGIETGTETVYFVIPDGQTVEKLMMGGSNGRRHFSVITDRKVRIPQAQGLGKKLGKNVEIERRRYHTNIKLVQN